MLVLRRDGYFVILSGERGKHWVLGEKGGIFMRRHRRRRRFGGIRSSSRIDGVEQGEK